MSNLSYINSDIIVVAIFVVFDLTNIFQNQNVAVFVIRPQDKSHALLILYRPCIVLDYINRSTKCTLLVCSFVHSICFERLFRSSSGVHKLQYQQLCTYHASTVGNVVAWYVQSNNNNKIIGILCLWLLQVAQTDVPQTGA